MTKHYEQLLESLENERRYVARELHDGVAQTTLQLGLQIGICRKLLERGMTDVLEQELIKLEERVRLASTQVREVIGDMRPPTVDPGATLDDYIQYVVNTHTQRQGPALVYHFNWSADTVNLSSSQTLTLVRIIQEGLLNIRKHAQAQNVELSFLMGDHGPYVTLNDDGVGFDFEGVQTLALNKRWAGLINMYSRAKAINGDLSVSSNPSTGGTKITLTLTP